MSKTVYIADNTSDSMQAEFNRIRSIALNQSRTGIVPQIAEDDQIERLNKDASQFANKYGENTDKFGPFYKYALSKACSRDLQYSRMGRKFMSVLGLTKKSMAAVNRMEAILQFDKMENE